jgi:3'(2'), 5'-bisphosphate nucleotidase
MQEELDTAKRLAVRAGAILLEHYSRQHTHGHSDPVGDARHSVNTFLVEELKRSFPGDGIVSTEDRDHRHAFSKSHVWIIDPLDGNLEFTRHKNEFAVMIGLSIDGAARLGVIYQPRTEKIYYAISGSSAFLMANRATHILQVSGESDPLAMTIACSRLHHTPHIDLLQRKIGINNAIFYGSIGLNVGLICEGLVHVYVHAKRRAKPWSTCASDVILHEAGGRLTNLSNVPIRYGVVEAMNLGPAIASNGAIHDRIIEAAKSILPEALS